MAPENVSPICLDEDIFQLFPASKDNHWRRHRHHRVKPEQIYQRQCDQMARLFVICLTIYNNKICSIAYKICQN